MTYLIKLRKHGILRRILSVWYEEGQAGETENTQRTRDGKYMYGGVGSRGKTLESVQKI